MKQFALLAACALFFYFSLTACAGTDTSSSTQAASVTPAPSANSENDTQGGELVGREILPVAPAPGDGLYEKICRCLYPYLITQATSSGYPLFKGGPFATAEYYSLLDMNSDISQYVI